ncbi:glycosyltransferase family 4 protein [Candidatus Saganbacteria bacterium]|nr:glycosyltransferase family 4 protein [Candidatus Saganbacteria bacterium]
MKIVMLVPYFYPHTGGTEKYVKDLSTGLANLGHQITIISNNLPTDKSAPAEEMMGSVKIIRLPAYDFLGYLPVSSAFNLEMVKDCDIIHVHVPAYGFMRAVAGKVKQPVIGTYHLDVSLPDHFAGTYIPAWLRKFVEFFADMYASFLIPKIDAMITTTEAYAAASPIMHKFPRRVIPIGIFYDQIDAAQKKLGLNPSKKRRNQILFLGRLAENKGCAYIVKALPEILASFPDTKLIICGQGEEEAHLRSMISSLGIEKSIEFYGVLNFEQLVEFFYTSMVYVFPSTSNLESFGIVQLEAMANYTPVIATDIPGPNMVIERDKTGVIVPVKDSKALAEKVKWFLANPDKAIEMGQAGRRLVETKYDWKTICAQIVDLYKEILEQKK